MAKAAVKNKQTAKPAPKDNKVVALRKSSEVATVSAKVLERAKKMQGAGSSSDASDNIVPFIYVLQSLSPVAMPKNPAYIEGAKAGDFWLRGSADPIVDGEEGFEFQPVNFSKCWIEWKPNREGFVARHATRPEEAVQVENDKGQMVWKMGKAKNANIVVETREVSGFVLGRGAPEPYVISFSGSGHTPAKEWNGMCQRFVEDGVKWPCWSRSYLVTNKYRSNDQGSWYTVQVKPLNDMRGDEDFERGEALHLAFASGEKRAADDDGRGHAGTSDDSADDDI
jgi:hypothetical protein